jgi:hypothetical protein
MDQKPRDEHIKQVTHLRIWEKIFYIQIFHIQVSASRTPDDGPMWPKRRKAVEKEHIIVR